MCTTLQWPATDGSWGKPSMTYSRHLLFGFDEKSAKSGVTQSLQTSKAAMSHVVHVVSQCAVVHAKM